MWNTPKLLFISPYPFSNTIWCRCQPQPLPSDAALGSFPPQAWALSRITDALDLELSCFFTPRRQNYEQPQHWPQKPEAYHNFPQWPGFVTNLASRQKLGSLGYYSQTRCWQVAISQGQCLGWDFQGRLCLILSPQAYSSLGDIWCSFSLSLFEIKAALFIGHFINGSFCFTMSLGHFSSHKLYALSNQRDYSLNVLEKRNSCWLQVVLVWMRSVTRRLRYLNIWFPGSGYP